MQRPYAPAPTTTMPVLYPSGSAAAEIAVVPTPAPALTLYQVPVPGAIEVTMPNGAVAWARPVADRLEPVAYPVRKRAEPLPVWVRASCYLPLALSLAGFVAAEALRVAVPALHGLVGLLDGLWRFGLVAAVIFGLIGLKVRSSIRGLSSGEGSATEAAPQPAPAPIYINGEGGDGGRWFSKGGPGIHIDNLTINR